MDSYIFVGLIVNAGLSLLVGYVASQKGRSGISFFLLSFFLSFLVGILVVLALPAVSDVQPDETSPDGKLARFAGDTKVKCPYCAEWVKAEAKVCKHCGQDIASDVSAILESETKRKQLEAQTARKAQQKLNAELLSRQAAKDKKSSERRSKVIAFLRRPLVALLLIGAGAVLLTVGIVSSASYFGNIANASVPPEAPSNLAVSELGFSWDNANETSIPAIEDALVTSYHFKLLSGETVIFEEDFSPGGYPDVALDSELSAAYRASGFPASLSFEVNAINKFGTSKTSSFEFEAPSPELTPQDLAVFVMIVPVAVEGLPEGLDAMLGPANEIINMWSQPIETTCVYSGVLENVITLTNTPKFVDACVFPKWNYSPTYKGAGTVTVEATTTFNGGRSVSYSNTTDVAGIKMY